MTTRVSALPPRLPISSKAALEKISERDGPDSSKFPVVGYVEKISAMETEWF